MIRPIAQRRSSNLRIASWPKCENLYEPVGVQTNAEISTHMNRQGLPAAGWLI